MRACTVAKLDTLLEADLDAGGARSPRGFEDTFGTYRLCLRHVADHWNVHGGHLAEARRTVGLRRMSL